MKEEKIKIASVFKEAFSNFTGRPEYSTIIKFLRLQENNLAVIEWFRVKSTDADIVRKKAYYEGQFDFIKWFIKTLEDSKKGEE